MGSYTIVLMCVVGLLTYNEISTLKKVIQDQEKRLNQLAKLTGHEDLSSYWVSDELKEQAIQLKRDGKKVEAIKKIREQTKMDLLEAKQYVDQL
ncbi:50S ribosomal protein L7/L12 [Clostridium sp. Marseille-P2415]|uniref:50S ribosomal protein L7/L12 n=1 Tax=Clostridium sp. Marseille-P2415 TaxID=1805471 RepID=UPI0009886F2F|nr:50S ribosomal protein L7/L12 [Clostridium sp. Marseille-P2415]